MFVGCVDGSFDQGARLAVVEELAAWRIICKAMLQLQYTPTAQKMERHGCAFSPRYMTVCSSLLHEISLSYLEAVKT